MFKQFGASVPDQALAVPVEPAHGLGPSGFDPSRVTVEAFRDWLSRQPADDEYSYCMPSTCAFAQFLASAGAKQPRVTPFDWRDGLHSDKRYPLPASLNDALADEPPTFGALAARLAEQASA